MKKVFWILYILCISCKVEALPPATHGILHQTSTTPAINPITSLSAGITSNFAHWNSAYSSSGSDGTAIDSVIDLSGNNRTISATSTGRPLYYSTGVNGKPAWLFDGTNDYFNIPSYTTYGAIMVVNNLRSNFSLLEGFYGSRSTGGANSFLGTNGVSGVLDFSPSGRTTLVNDYISWSTPFKFPSMSTLKVLSFQTTTGVTDATGYQIGSDRKYGPRWLNGYYCEVIGLSAPLTRKQMDTVHSYLWQKWSIPTPINLLVAGNSIGIGSASYIQDSIRATNDCAMRNASVGGQTTLQQFFTAPTVVDTCYGFPFDKNVVYLLEGTNDLINANVDTCYEHFTRYINARKAAGWKVVISTVLSRDTTLKSGYESKRQALNSLITAMSQDNNFKVVDFGQDANLSSTMAYANNTYFLADGIHPTVAGYKLIAKYVAAVIKSFTW